jgi:hypothetical protein
LVSVPSTALSFDLSAIGGVHGVAQTFAPRACARRAVAVSGAEVPLPS